MHTNNRHTHSAQECYVFLFIILLYSPSSCVRRIRVNTGCVLRTRLYDIQRCYCVYGPTLTEVVRAGRAGTRVPARLRRTSADYRPIAHDFSLLSLSRVPCTVGCPIPVPRKRGVFCATASICFPPTPFSFFPPTNVCTVDSASVLLFLGNPLRHSITISCDTYMHFWGQYTGCCIKEEEVILGGIGNWKDSIRVFCLAHRLWENWDRTFRIGVR